MHKYIQISFIIFSAVAIGHGLSRFFNLYYGFVFTDIALHVISGMGLGYIWLWFIRGTRMNVFAIYISLASFAVLGSFLWEVWEASAWQIIPETMQYIPELNDSLLDIACGLIGGIIVGVLHAHVDVYSQQMSRSDLK